MTLNIYLLIFLAYYMNAEEKPYHLKAKISNYKQKR